MDGPGTITDKLLALGRAEVPTEAAAMMRLSLFDWAACGIAGARDGEFRGFVAAQAARTAGPCTVIGGGSAAPADAALLNGTLSHALDYDDTHFAHIGHPSVAILPAILALAEEAGLTADAVIEAATVGVEGSILTGLWLGRDHYQVGYHQTATAGAFGAVLGACRLLDLDVARTRNALGLCASMASGLKAQFGTMAKPLNAGLAARTGVEAALWAQAGMTAARDGLAGPLGFGPTHHGQAAEVSLPGESWRIMAISHKFHACCHGLHAMLEALSRADAQADDVAALQIRTHPRWMSVCNIAEPATGLEAKFSYRQTAAMLLLGHDTAAVESFTDAITREPRVVALRDVIEVSEDAALSEMQAALVLRLRDGSEQRLSHDLAAPIGMDALSDKLRRKGAALLGRDAAQALWEAAQGGTLRQLTDQLVMS